MFKKLALAALGAISVSAFAQSSDSMQDPSTMTYTDAKNAVVTRAFNSINAGDAYVLSNIMDRAPTTIANALAFGLAHNHWQAKIISEELALARYPVDSTSYTTTVTNPDGTVTTTTTTTSTTYNTTYAENMRPMRMAMESNQWTNMDWNQALDILTANITTAEATQLRDWWWNRATEREKDVIVRSLKANAKMGNTVSYSSIRRSS
jgi:hypothetical protein